MIVYAQQLLTAADEMEQRRSPKGALSNGIVVTPALLRKAGEILRSDMPGFLETESQDGRGVILQVGILPARRYRIDGAGEATDA